MNKNALELEPLNNNNDVNNSERTDLTYDTGGNGIHIRKSRKS